MSWQFFSLWGYLSILLWLAVPALWAAHAARRPRRWLCHWAVVVALVALLFAELNSKTHVNRIQIDHSEEIAAAQARQEAERKKAEAARSGEVAQVRFAEDNAADYLDAGGMDDADRKYMTAVHEDVTPEWKKQKKARSQTGAPDDSLEAQLDPTTGKEKGVDADEVEASAEEPIMMPERQMMLANRLDGMNLKLIRWLILIGVGVVVTDYLKRVNHYEEACLPLPLPSAWVNALTPLPTVRSWPAKPRRAMPQELEWLTRRGDTFLYVTDDPRAAARLPEQTWRIRRPRLGAVDIIHVSDDNPVDPDFIFETLWYGRGSFVVDSTVRAAPLLARMFERLQQRKASRAHVRQTVHVIWDLPTVLPPETVAAFEGLGRATGFALVIRPG